ncbi:MAG: hypothetical protein HY081_03005 [Gammaproteobacteria bacterium]|nr:hypothetical protein [Gammaproteobacteria bacterium]
MDFSLRFTQNKAPFDYGAQSYDTVNRWIGISWREKISSSITLGMFGGSAYVTQNNNPVTAGIELDGYHAGFSAQGIFFTTARAALFYALDYTYQKVDNKTATQTVVIDWSEPHAQIGAIVKLAPRWRMYGGGNYGYVDGQERASGNINHTLNFSRATRAGGFLGIDLTVDVDGYVGIEGKTGLTRGAEIYFKRRF